MEFYESDNVKDMAIAVRHDQILQSVASISTTMFVFDDIIQMSIIKFVCENPAVVPIISVDLMV